jgi:hypothetical protein
MMVLQPIWVKLRLPETKGVPLEEPNVGSLGHNVRMP